MGEHPVGAQGAAPLQPDTGEARSPAYPAYLLHPWQPPRPRVVIRADLVPAVSILSTVSLLGFAVAFLWSRLAPPQRMVIGNDGNPFPLPAESYHRFDALVVFALLGLAAGLCTGLAVWFLRGRRGPVVMVAAVLGSVAGGWLASLLGVSWAAARFPVDTDVEVLDVVLVAPRLESMWVLLAWPMATALMYGLLAAWNAMDDLGRRLD